MKNLSDRISATGSDLFWDGEKIFSDPMRSLVKTVGVLQGPKDSRPFCIYVGTGACCHGHLYLLQYETKKPSFSVLQIISVDVNVRDIIPVTYTKASSSNEHRVVLVTGYGCAGAGVRLVDTYYPSAVDVLPTTAFWEPVPNGRDGHRPHVAPRFAITEDKRLHLDYWRCGLRPRPGKTRDPRLPACLVNYSTEEDYVTDDKLASVDLSPRLLEIGVNIPSTLKLLHYYHRTEIR